MVRANRYMRMCACLADEPTNGLCSRLQGGPGRSRLLEGSILNFLQPSEFWLGGYSWKTYGLPACPILCGSRQWFWGVVHILF